MTTVRGRVLLMSSKAFTRAASVAMLSLTTCNAVFNTVFCTPVAAEVLSTPAPETPTAGSVLVVDAVPVVLSTSAGNPYTADSRFTLAAKVAEVLAKIVKTASAEVFDNAPDHAPDTAVSVEEIT